MRRLHIIEISILAVIIIFGYKCIEALITSFVSVAYLFKGRYPDMSFVFEYILYAGIYFGITVLILKNGCQIAAYIDKQWQPLQNEDPTKIIGINVHKEEFLFIILVAYCLITIISQLPDTLIGIYDYFKKESGGYRDKEFNTWEDTNFKTAALKLLFSTIILFYAKAISSRLSRTIPGKEVVIETSPNN